MIYLLCLKIFLVRIFDVSLGTFRTILTVKGKTLYASLVGFFEVLVWFLVVREALNTDESGFLIAIAYSLGFATGTFIGGLLSKKFIVTTISVQVITTGDVSKILNVLKKNNYGCSVIDIEGYNEEIEKKMIIVETTNRRVNELTTLINKIDNKAFVVVNETKYIQNGFLK
ncbi:MAG: DUF2179 domain-containing protein [Bacilli bacterium]|nr:DUF2179 domain-containing protein [Bacilli bacterium]